MCRGTMVPAQRGDLRQLSVLRDDSRQGLVKPRREYRTGSGKIVMATALASDTSAALSSKAKGASGALRILSILVTIIGALFLVVGVTMYGITSAQLKAQKVTVAPWDEGSNGEENGFLAGHQVADPFSALAQIGAIGHHMQQAGAKATGGQVDAETGVVTGGDWGLTYGTTPSVTLLADGTCKSAVNWTDPEGNGTFTCEKGGEPVVTGGVTTAIATLRTTLNSGSLLIASLYVSVLAFGVSALAAGLGVVLILVGVFQVLAIRSQKVIA